MRRQKTGNASTSQEKTVGSETKSSTTGTVLTLEPGTNNTYLCAHICAAKKTPKIGNVNQNLYQITLATAIQAEAEANYGVWAYLAEVGYDMSLPFPKPLMSDKPERMHRPSSFPLGAAKRQIENFSKGALRIPDVVILTVKAAGIIAMRQSGVIEWDRFYPEGANIERVVDVKFGKDDWFAGQYQAYLKIAPGKVREIRDRDCSCDTRKPPNGGVKIPVYPPIKNPMPYKSATFRPTNLALAPTKGIPSMLGGLGKMVAPPSPKVIFYRKFVPLQEYRGMMIPITASVGIVGAFICGTVVFAGAAAGVGITAGAIGASEAVSGGLLITGFATLSHAN